MFCKNCGAELVPNTQFCSNCGCKTEEISSAGTQDSPLVCPKTYLLESILVTLFCCLPFGIVGIINAANVSSNFAAGRYQEAETASMNAKKYLKIGVIISAVMALLYCVVLLIGLATGGL